MTTATETRNQPRTRDAEWRDRWSPPGGDAADLVAGLPAVQRLLLTTDGTVTTALATLLDEPISVRMVAQRQTVLAQDDDELGVDAGERVIERRVVLHGAESRTPLLYGASRIVPGRLPDAARRALVGGGVAIGIVLRSHQIETFRAPLSVGVGPASCAAAGHLGTGLMCQRRYVIRAAGRALMTVHEEFPAAGFGVGR